MPYIDLKKLYYADKEAYEQTYHQRFHGDGAIHLDFEVSGYPAFFLQTDDVVFLLNQILKLDKEIALLCNHLPGKALAQYARKCLIDEIVITNNIEGVYSSRKEIGEALALFEKQSQHKGKAVKFLGIVNKYAKLTENEYVSLDTCQDIRNLYDALVLQEVMAESKNNLPDGQIFRKEMSEVYAPSGKSIHKGLYPETKIITAMEKALKVLHDDSVLPLFRICIFHYLLEYIHPFYDGNGRLGRFILSYCMAGQLEHLSALRISSTIKENISKYYKAFSTCNDRKNRADMTPFLITMLELICATEEELLSSLESRRERWEQYENQIPLVFKPKNEKEADLYSVLIQAALFSEQGVPTKGLLSILQTTHTTLKVKLDRLKKQGFLIETKRGNEKYYQMNLSQLDAAVQS